MKVAVIVVFAFALLQQITSPPPRPPEPSVPKQESKSNASPNTTDQNSNAVEPAKNASTVRIVSLPPITTLRDIPTFVISAILAIVGIAGIIVAICTVRIIKRQTEHVARQAQSMRYQTTHLKNAAMAAKLSADASIASERAWVMVDLEKVPGMGTVDGIENGVSHRSIFVRVRCLCTNHGKTPAWIVEKRACLLIVQPAAGLPIEPDLNIEIQDASLHYLDSEPFKDEWTVECEDTESMGSMKVIYGVVKYRHLFSEQEVQTTFGYRVTVDGELERLTGYRKYNENT